jgi:hypothetical protein
VRSTRCALRAAGQNQNCISARLHSRAGDKRQCTPLKRVAPPSPPVEGRPLPKAASLWLWSVVSAGGWLLRGSGPAAGRIAGAAASNGGGGGPSTGDFPPPWRLGPVWHYARRVATPSVRLNGPRGGSAGRPARCLSLARYMQRTGARACGRVTGGLVKPAINK